MPGLSLFIYLLYFIIFLFDKLDNQQRKRPEFIWPHRSRLQLLLAEKDHSGLQQRAAGRQCRENGEETTRETEVR